MTRVHFPAKIILSTVFIALLVSCSSKSISNDGPRSGRTVLLFLVDGLPLKTLQTELGRGSLPQMRQYFLEDSRQMYIARTTFPSLTYPAISALLTEKPIDHTGIFGNQITDGARIVNFESPGNRPRLNDMIKDRNIFSRLGQIGFKTVSLDYAFQANASKAVNSTDIQAALDILNKHYFSVDQGLIQTLKSILSENDPKNWPDFIFVHLVGVDFTSHDLGPNSKEVKEYLRLLDSELASVFRVLTDAEVQKQRQIVTLLTADHGFDQDISSYFNLQEFVRHEDRGIQILNEGRYLGLKYPSYWSSEQKGAFINKIMQLSEMDIAAYREDENFFIQSKIQGTKVRYIPATCAESSFAISVMSQSPTCPENLGGSLNQLFYPFFISNLSYYFQSPGHPDAILLPRPGVSLKRGYKGQHGGPTSNEIYIPLLMRGSRLENLQRIPALWEVLRFMGR